MAELEIVSFNGTSALEAPQGADTYVAKKAVNFEQAIVTVSVNERNPRESKIGLTMRQAGLGRLDWIQDLGNKEEN